LKRINLARLSRIDRNHRELDLITVWRRPGCSSNSNEPVLLRRYYYWIGRFNMIRGNYREAVALARGCVVLAPAYALSLNYAGCLTSSVGFSFSFSFQRSPDL
jgi:hypothetical protein